MTAGAKLKLTPAVQKKITDAIAGGNYNVVAAQFAGIGQSTFYLWLEQGENAQSGKKREFWEAVKDAEARAETRNVLLIERAADTQWQAAAWMLERKHYDRWGRKERHELTGKDGDPIALTTLAEVAKSVAGTQDDDGHSN